MRFFKSGLGPAVLLLSFAPLAAQDPQPFAEPRVAQREATVTRPQYETQMQDAYRTVLVPQTRYHYEYRFRPLRPGASGYYLVPTVTYATRVEKVRVPVTTRTTVTETKLVSERYLALGFRPAPGIQVTQGPAQPAPAAPGALTWRPAPVWRASQPSLAPQSASGAVGGVVRYDGDPPRYGLRASEVGVARGGGAASR